MINQMMTVVQKRTIAKDTVEMVLQGSTISFVEPGQFVHIRIGTGFSHMLRRPISIANVDGQEQTITVIFKVIGQGTEELQNVSIGSSLDVLLGCGTSYPVQGLELRRALLIGGGIGVPPLYYLAKELRKKGVQVTSILGFQSKENVFYEEEFKNLGACHIVTDDGSYGWHGNVNTVIDSEQIPFDYFFSCGPLGMLRAVSTKLIGQPGYISIEERMGCGIGACYACVVPAKDGKGFRKICKDGPVFPAGEVVL
ncbi:dihydroorotate dehydrogenase electron transfer subunit [Radiobacillus deserti]|uniref:Dihydroorotate dehydrogenase B (NAD(+)), electron transfer subunit n=1 Tax=Radiobacillus deserti TaxID=2594883 RepID=A0A516KFC9_9BACI|nr:dihydroorotate dehydrogenase electron transfer subunit [Radiobacillus deserti]QDP40115.1 dihydroorotate dehydrogenase electron transfer subunit [Radiobacillus deserti]